MQVQEQVPKLAVRKDTKHDPRNYFYEKKYWWPHEIQIFFYTKHAGLTPIKR